MTAMSDAPAPAALDVERLVARYDGRVPRYTSYPTAPHFTPAVGPSVYARWLKDLPADRPLSLYLHVPVLRPALPLLRLQHLGRPARILASPLRRAAAQRDRRGRG